MRLGTPGFVPERLTMAREARGVSATALAELAHVSRQLIHRYESGPTSPGYDVLERLADVLGVPPHYFLKPLRGEPEAAVFARSMSAATKTARLRARRLLQRVQEIASELGELATLPKVDIPDLGIPNDPLRLGLDEIEDIANRLRRAWGLGDGPISNMTWLLENHGIVVSRASIEARTLDAISQWIGDRPYVLLNEDMPLGRARFDLGHELAHVILHRHVPESALKTPTLFKLIEAQAHRFGAAFVFPQASFAREAIPTNLDRFLDLKRRWRVSVKMMIHRTSELRLASQEDLVALYRRYSWRKWTGKEPLDDELPPEIPKFLANTAALLVDQQVVPEADLFHRFGLKEAEVKRLICAVPGHRDATLKLVR